MLVTIQSMAANLVLSVVLYGCKYWSLASNEENRLRLFENKVPLENICSKAGEVTGLVKIT
jgi:hypothetical protein